MANRLASETSPYLLQHKDNPVDWHPWSAEAFQIAKDQHKPVFLSVGYSACHWCHVMERESFEDDETASVMNTLFVNIKVDREERPDVDSIYMSAVQSMTGHGGWPMSVFLTPEGVPFYGGTYFPNQDRGGMPSFQRVLLSVAEAYKERHAEITDGGNRVIEAIKSQTAPRISIEPIAPPLFHDAYRHLAPEFDWQRGGFGLQPKFPQPMIYEFLLAHAKLQQNDKAADFVYLTLERMARGGIYDQIAGGFHRYSVDSVWLVPHFEKMLYDNALLATLYLHAWQSGDNPLFKRIAEETLEYLAREMRHPESGAFYSATDADSEGEEGKFFTWHEWELRKTLGDDLAHIASRYWGVTRDGNFEGANILHVPSDQSTTATRLNISESELHNRINEARRLLYTRRQQRVAPLTDDKVITSWNALAIRAFAEAGAILQRNEWIQIATQCAQFILQRLRRAHDNRLMRTCKVDPDSVPTLPAYLEDYAYLADALLHLYEATFDIRWLQEAQNLCQDMLTLFWDDDDAVFYDTGSDQDDLVVRPRDVFDNAHPSGGSAAAMTLLRCSEFTADAHFERHASATLRSVRDLMARAPSGFSWWLQAAQFYANPVKQIAIVGNPDDPDTRSMISLARNRYSPDRIIAVMNPGSPDADQNSPTANLPLFQGRHMIDNKPTAYVCENYICNLPVTDPHTLANLLNNDH